MAKECGRIARARGAQRRFPEALSLLDAVYTLYERHGDRSNAGRAMISKGLYTGYGNDPERAIQLLIAGLEMMLGQIFLVTLVAGLVSLWRPGEALRKRRKQRAEDGGTDLLPPESPG